MRSVHVKLKSGGELSGPLWEWCPKEGYFTLVDEEGVNGGLPIRVELWEVESAVHVTRTALGAIESVNLTDRAVAEGWNWTL